jgi:hypothetical protein
MEAANVEDFDRVLDILQEAFTSGRLNPGRRALDEWEAKQDRSRDVLSTLRFYRDHLEQLDQAIAVGLEMLQGEVDEEATRMCDYHALTELYIKAGDPESAWKTLQNVLNWPDLRNWYDVGMARSTLDEALDISAMVVESTLKKLAFETAVHLISDGSSTSYDILCKVRDRAAELGRQDIHQEFSKLAEEELTEINRQLGET